MYLSASACWWISVQRLMPLMRCGGGVGGGSRRWINTKLDNIRTTTRWYDEAYQGVGWVGGLESTDVYKRWALQKKLGNHCQSPSIKTPTYRLCVSFSKTKLYASLHLRLSLDVHPAVDSASPLVALVLLPQCLCVPLLRSPCWLDGYVAQVLFWSVWRHLK